MISLNPHSDKEVSVISILQRKMPRLQEVRSLCRIPGPMTGRASFGPSTLIQSLCPNRAVALSALWASTRSPMRLKAPWGQGLIFMSPCIPRSKPHNTECWQTLWLINQPLCFCPTLPQIPPWRDSLAVVRFWILLCSRYCKLNKYQRSCRHVGWAPAMLQAVETQWWQQSPGEVGQAGASDWTTTDVAWERHGRQAGWRRWDGCQQGCKDQ